MFITLVAAIDKNRVIGYKNRLPWHLPADLAHFKSVTLGKPIIMGRKTFESIGNPLPLRRNIVISRQAISIEGCEIFPSVNEVLNSLVNEPEVMIIGGGRLFKEMLPKADKMLLTVVHHSFKGDTYFPWWNADEWVVVSEIEHKVNENNQYPLSFLELQRRRIVIS